MQISTLEKLLKEKDKLDQKEQKLKASQQDISREKKEIYQLLILKDEQMEAIVKQRHALKEDQYNLDYFKEKHR